MMNRHRTTDLKKEEDYNLTPMELSCLALVANGYRSHEISGEMKTSEAEVDMLLSGIEQKLGAKNRLHAIGIAISQGLIGIDSK